MKNINYILVLQILIIFPWIIECQDQKYLRIPEGLKIGVASSAYQIEGGWNQSDKSESNWDVYTHEKSHKISDQSNGDVACDSYNRYKEDIQIIKNAGFNHYRLSLSWARILPTGFANKISKDGIQYYKNVLDELHANGIEPYVTLYHWDHPGVLDKMGSWLNELMVDYFVDYARVVFQELGSRTKVWITINEGNVMCTEAYGGNIHAPALNMSRLGSYMCAHNMLKAHARVYRMYDEEFRNTQNGKISLTLSCFHSFPADANEQSDSADVYFQRHCGWFAHPIYSRNGDYPPILRKRIDENSKLEGYPFSRLPVFSSYWVKYIKGTFDYYGLNHYTSRITHHVSKDEESGWFDDVGVSAGPNASWPVAASNWLNIVPEGLGGILRKIKAEYNNPPVYILENGYSSEGSKFEIVDTDRINYFYGYMKEMLLAINRDLCNVKVYTVWSILDNFEWSNGYTKRFGIVHVNFTDGRRTPRRSVDWLNQVIRTRKLQTFEEFDNKLNQ